MIMEVGDVSEKRGRPIGVTVMLDKGTYEALSKASVRLGMSKSRIIYRAIQLYLTPEGHTIEELARDLISRLFKAHLLTQTLVALHLGLDATMEMAHLSGDEKARERAFKLAWKAVRLSDRILDRLEELLEADFRGFEDVERVLGLLQEAELGVVGRLRLGLRRREENSDERKEA